MDRDRRRILQGAGLALVGGGFLSRVDRVAAMQPPTSLTAMLGAQATGRSEALLVKPEPDAEGPPKPATYDRRPWTGTGAPSSGSRACWPVARSRRFWCATR